MFTNNKLENIPYKESPNKSGPIRPKFAVLHYTAGWSAEGSIEWLLNSKSKASAHLVISRSGEITQLVPFNLKAWHAGPSFWNGYKNLNGHSIGIELDNPGWIKHDGNQNNFDSGGRKLSMERFLEYDWIPAKHSRVSGGEILWATYTSEQLTSLDEVIDTLIHEYHLEDIVTHEEIDTRGWKTDPGPAFPIEKYKKLLFGRHDPTDEQFKVNVQGLNVRGGPGTIYDVLGTFHNADVVTLLDRSNEWLYVEKDALKGWIHGRYANKVR